MCICRIIDYFCTNIHTQACSVISLYLYVTFSDNFAYKKHKKQQQQTFVAQKNIVLSTVCSLSAYLITNMPHPQPAAACVYASCIFRQHTDTHTNTYNHTYAQARWLFPFIKCKILVVRHWWFSATSPHLCRRLLYDYFSLFRSEFSVSTHWQKQMNVYECVFMRCVFVKKF